MSAQASEFYFVCDADGCGEETREPASTMLDAANAVQQRGWAVGWGISGGPIPVKCPNHRTDLRSKERLT